MDIGRHSARCRPFQLTAARRRLADLTTEALTFEMVSTHSRPKAAGKAAALLTGGHPVSTHSRPKAAGYTLAQYAADE